MTASTKTTTLEGYYATGDCECFCFDKCSGPSGHHEQVKADLDHYAWFGEERDPDRCRVYPGDLLPENSSNKRGTWTIAITFTPDEGENV